MSFAQRPHSDARRKAPPEIKGTGNGAYDQRKGDAERTTHGMRHRDIRWCNNTNALPIGHRRESFREHPAVRLDAYVRICPGRS